MIGFLRFIGVVNASIWFGSAIFFTFVAGPTFFSDEMKRLFPPPYNGLAAQMLLQKYFLLNHVCALIALTHLALEKLYAGRVLERFTLGILITIFGLSLLGGYWLQPKLKELHRIHYRGPVAQREAAGKSFRAWHGVSQTANLAMTAGLLFYLWRVTSLNNPSRLPGFRKLSVGWK